MFIDIILRSERGEFEDFWIGVDTVIVLLWLRNANEVLNGEHLGNVMPVGQNLVPII